MTCPFIQWTASNELKCILNKDGECKFSHMDRVDLKVPFKPAGTKRRNKKTSTGNSPDITEQRQMGSTPTPTSTLQASNKRKDAPESGDSSAAVKRPRRNLKVPHWTGFDNGNIRVLDEPCRQYKLQAAMELEDTDEKHVLFLSIQVRKCTHSWFGH